MKKNKLLIVIVVLILLITAIFSVKYYINSQELLSYPNMSSDEELCADISTSDTETQEIEKKPKIKTGYKVGQRIPNLKLTNAKGNVVNLYDLIEGKEKFILNLSADWCSDSQREKDKLEKVYSDFEENNIGVAVVYVNLSKESNEKKTNVSQIENYLDKSNFSFPTFIDYDNSLMNKFEVSSVPTNIIIDEHGIIKGHTEEIDMDNLLLENKSEFRVN